MQPTIIRITPSGRLANLMGQLMFAECVKRQSRHAIKIEGYDIPEWGLYAQATDSSPSDITIGSHLTRSKLCSGLIDAFRPRLINLPGIVFRCGNYAKPASYLGLFPEANLPSLIPDDHLLIHIRAGDVSTPTHPRYGPMPIRYYEYLVSQTGLRPVFIGEIDSSPYIDCLRKTFPRSDLIGGKSAISDFQILRSAKNVALSISTFAWLATFLSTRTQCIHLPLAGIFDPRETPITDFLPLDDSRYIFHDLCREAWVNRYTNPIGPSAGYSLINRNRVRLLKYAANIVTLKQAIKVHGGLLKRMAREGIQL